MPVFKISSGKHRLVYLCFFLSGGTGLVYQVLWARQLGLVFGNTMYAISVVLAAFMAGLGIGTYLVSKFLERYPHPLSVYAILELGIGLWALMVPYLLDKAEYLHIILHPILEFSVILDSLSHFGLSGFVILFPTILMGGTLPALTTCCTERLPELGGRLSLLYALNTLGAAMGTLWVGFYALPWLGINFTNIAAAVINILIGIFFLSPELFSSPSKTLTQPDRAIPSNKKVSYFLMGGMGVAGFSAMIYEIAWTRVLIMVLGSSTYAFSCILLAFLLGIALGSFIYNRLLKKINLGLSGFCIIQILIGAFSLLSLPAFSLLPRFYLILYNLFPPEISWAVQSIRFIIPMAIMIVPTTFMGLGFPLAAKLYSQETEEVTICVCQVYGFNVLGNVFGAVVTGFFLLTFLGVQNTLKLAIILNLSIGIFGALLIKPRFALAFTGAALSVLGLTIIQPQWNKYLMDSGVGIYGGAMNIQKPLEDQLYHSDMLYFKEGTGSIVSVYQKPNGNRFLRINGKTDASTNAIDMSTQLLLGYIPIFLHPEPQDALVIGLGGGITANAVAQYDFIRQVDCVEIEPAVVEAAEYFNRYNQNVLKNPKVNLIVEDGRGYLKQGEKTYDLIISEPSNPWIKGIGNLFSVEYYQLCRRQLNLGGIMCQWVQIYELSPEVLKMIVNSFRQAFPYCQLWFNPPGNAFLLGSDKPLIYDLDHVDRILKNNKTGNDVHTSGLAMDSPLSFLAYFELNNEEITEFTKGAGLNTDNHPKLEFLAPYNLAMNTIIPNYQLIRSYKKKVLPENIKTKGRKITQDTYYYWLSKVYLLTGLSRRMNTYMHWAYYHINQALNINNSDPRFYLVRGRINAAREAFKEAEDDFKRSIGLDSKNHKTYFELARLYQTLGRLSEAENNYLKALDIAPQNEELQFSYAKFLGSQGRYEQALVWAGKLTAAPLLKGFEVWEFIGDISLKLGDIITARSAFEESYRLNKSNYEANIKLSEMDIREGKVEQALKRLASHKDVLAYYHPHDTRFLNLLYNCYMQLGQHDKAAEIQQTILRQGLDNLSDHTEDTHQIH